MPLGNNCISVVWHATILQIWTKTYDFNCNDANPCCRNKRFITCDDDAAPALLEAAAAAVRPYMRMSKLWVADTDEHWLGALKYTELLLE